MDISANPHYRLVTAPSAEEAGARIALPLWMQIGRGVAMVAILTLSLFLLSVGTVESRVTYLLMFLLAFINPVWGIYATALLGPLFLLDQSKTHMLGGLEILTLGTLGAEIRLLDRPTKNLVTRNESLRVYWGVWPHFLTGLFLVLCASSMVGLQLLMLREQLPGSLLKRLHEHAVFMFYLSATEPEWTLKALWNWGTGAALAIVAARRMDAISVARWLKIGGLSMLASCGLALMDWAGWMSLTHIRRPNPDPLQVGRLQGLAGHPGWFGEWIAMMWPGLLLWFSPGRTKRNLVLGASLVLVLLALLLTAARAPWVGIAVAAAMGGVVVGRTYPATRRWIPWILAVAAAVFLIGVVAGGETLRTRLVHLLRVSDRTNYYVSGLMFLREDPFGIGLGTHFRFYDWQLLPAYPWFQSDHVTAHSLWLHTLIECGPFVPLLLAAGVAGVAMEFLRSRPLMDRHTALIALALAMSLVGMLVISIPQYVVYIRIIEVSIWIGAGALVGLCRQVRCQVQVRDEIESARGRRVLLACGVAAAITASFNAGRVYAGNVPRYIGTNDKGGYEFWTASTWRTAIGSDVEKVSFSLYRKHSPVEVNIHWPDGRIEHVALKPEEYRYFEFHQDPQDPNPMAAAQWLQIDASPLWTPANWEEGNNDERPLGVYISDMRFQKRGT